MRTTLLDLNHVWAPAREAHLDIRCRQECCLHCFKNTWCWWHYLTPAP